jgi:hypothetical protein
VYETNRRREAKITRYWFLLLPHRSVSAVVTTLLIDPDLWGYYNAASIKATLAGISGVELDTIYGDGKVVLFTAYQLVSFSHLVHSQGQLRCLWAPRQNSDLLVALSSAHYHNGVYGCALTSILPGTILNIEHTTIGAEAPHIAFAWIRHEANSCDIIYCSE